MLLGGPSLAVPWHLNIKGLVLVRREEISDLEKFHAPDKTRKQVKMCCQNYRHSRKYISRSLVFMFFSPFTEILACFPGSGTWLKEVLKPIFESLSVLDLVVLHSQGFLSLWIEST